jgi:AsnC-type helix-turn-helix domain
MEMSSSNYVCKPKHEIDTFDVKIIRCLSRDCRTSYTKIDSIVGITPNAIKERISTMEWIGNHVDTWSSNRKIRSSANSICCSTQTCNMP